MINRLLIIMLFLFIKPFSCICYQPVQYPFFSPRYLKRIYHYYQVTFAIIKDAKGFYVVWDRFRLNRYDMATPLKYSGIKRTPTSLNDDLIVKIQEGPHNKFWIDTRYGQCIFRSRFRKKPILTTLAYCRQLMLLLRRLPIL